MKEEIKFFVMDVDGTLTDGKIYMSASGELMKAFDVKDGYGIVQFRKAGGIPIVITGRKSKIVENRCAELGIEELHQGVDNKLTCLREIAARYGIDPSGIAYIGDDLNDADCLRFCGITACPADASEEIKPLVTYVCRKNGGSGAVREFIDWLR